MSTNKSRSTITEGMKRGDLAPGTVSWALYLYLVGHGDAKMRPWREAETGQGGDVQAEQAALLWLVFLLPISWHRIGVSLNPIRKALTSARRILSGPIQHGPRPACVPLVPERHGSRLPKHYRL